VARRRIHAATNATVNEAEISHFSRLSSEWWDDRGEFSFLHRMNPTRVRFIQEKVAEIASEAATHNVDPRVALQGLEVLDVGCGGGLLSESLARLGANTTGIDASPENIGIASLHAARDAGLSRLAYQHTTSDALLEEPTPKQYDVVTSLEVLEHVDNPAHFLKTCCDLVKPGGHLFLSTMARTPLAYALTILVAEDLLGIVTKGTHTWSKYVNPEELVDYFKKQGWINPEATTYLPRHQVEVKGLLHNPLSGNWSLGPRNSLAAAQCNYIFWVRKPSAEHNA